MTQTFAAVDSLTGSFRRVRGVYLHYNEEHTSPSSARDGTVGRGALLPHPRALMLASRSTLKDFFRLS